MKAFHAALIQSSILHQKQSRKEFQKIGLTTGQPKILSHLTHQEGCLQKDLGRICKVEPATMTVLLKSMVNKDLVYKKEVYLDNGKRGNLIFLTNLGKVKATEVLRIVAEIEETSFKGFTDDEKCTLITLLDRISSNLQ